MGAAPSIGLFAARLFVAVCVMAGMGPSACAWFCGLGLCVRILEFAFSFVVFIFGLAGRAVAGVSCWASSTCNTAGAVLGRHRRPLGLRNRPAMVAPSGSGWCACCRAPAPMYGLAAQNQAPRRGLRRPTSSLLWRTTCRRIATAPLEMRLDRYLTAGKAAVVDSSTAAES